MNIRRFLTIAAVSSMLLGGAIQHAQAAPPAHRSAVGFTRGTQVAAYDDFYKALENSKLEVPPMGVLHNDEGYWQGARLTAELVTPAAYGTVILNPNGSFIYVPTADFVGVDTFTYQARMGKITALATVVIDVAATKPMIVANNDEYKMTVGTALSVYAPGVLSNDSTGFELAVAPILYPKYGKLALDADGGFIYIPPADFVGVDTFVYSVSDGKQTSLAQVTIRVSKDDAVRIKPRK